MPSVVAHAVAGVALGAYSLPAVSRARLLLSMAALAVVPDLDVIGFRFDVPYTHPLGHRGFSHSLAFAAVAGVATAVLLFRDQGVGSTRWWRICGLLILATASHGMLDAFTDAGHGVGFLIPFDETRYFALWRPLATSPLSASAFFSARGLQILGNEVLWIGLPAAAFLLLRAALVGRFRKQ